MIDATELHRLAADLGTVEAKVVPKVKPVVSRGALNIKNALQRDARSSAHFAPVASSIGYELTEDNTGVQAEIGPDRDRGGGAGLLGGYWGWSRGGGGTLTDPLVALGEEEPRFVESIAKVAGYVFD